MRHKILLAALLLAMIWPTQTQAQLLINEIMQGNVDCVIDEDNDIPDSWVELYNPGNSSVNLKDFRLGTTSDYNAAWQLPEKKLPGRGIALIYCDKNATGFHTNFKLDSGKGGSVILFNSEGKAIDYMADLKKQPAPNISYGRENDGESKCGYMLTPTPGKPNTGGTVKKDQILGEPVFSKAGSVNEAQNGRSSVSLSLPSGTPDGTVIRYTTDGSEPTMANGTTLKLTDGKGSVTIRGTTIVRARLFCDGWLSPRSTTHSFIYHGHEQTIPIISLTTDSKFLYDDKLGIYIEGNGKDGKKNYEFNWKRPVHFEYFAQPDSPAELNQLCETRICGAASRGHQVKSLALYAEKRLGVKRLNYEFFPTAKPGKTEFKSLMLRNAGNDFDYLYFRDAAMQHNMGTKADIDWQAWQPTAVYINGTYLGMLNIRERSNEDNIYTNYDGLEDIDMFENWWELKEGTWDEFNKFKAYYENRENTNMDGYAELMDIDEFINVMVLNIFHNNLDFPGNNIVQWRERKEGAKWRWVVKDTDFGLGLYDRTHEYRYLDWLYRGYSDGNDWANEWDHTRLFRRLMEDQRFKDRLIDRFAVFMSDFLNGNGLAETIDSMYNVIKTEYPYHRNLINRWWPNHSEEVGKAKEWAKNRTAFMWQYLKDYFHLPGAQKPVFINQTLSDSDASDISLTINDTPVRSGKFRATLFSGREVRIASESVDRLHKVAGWTMETNVAGQTTTTRHRGSSLTFTLPTNAALVNITADIRANAIETVSPDHTTNGSTAIYTTDGRSVTSPDKAGVYIVKRGREVRKVIF